MKDLQILAVEKEDSYELFGVVEQEQLPALILFLWMVSTQYEILNLEFLIYEK